MGRTGILGEDERVELLGGEIIVMAAIGNRHAACVLRLNARLNSDRLAGRALVQVQNPVAADPYSEPQPDLMLLAHRDDHYDFDHPSPGDVLLLVEVAASSLDYDRHTKVPFYALAGIREVWIVDLEADRIEAYSDPEAGHYRNVRRYVPGESIAPSALPDLELAVAALIPGRRPADAAR
ncbi:MAG: Uma2 family endonuclease [Spirochaetaceae bacterium]|nr:Uma2 family endonuclease [Spirochaetaceae bacterium]